MPESYPNQKTIFIHRNMPKQTKEDKRPFVAAYTDSIETAARTIHKPTSFKLYMYFLCNKNEYRFALSPQDFSNRYGVSVDAAKDAVNDLISLGYLVLREKKTYDFYEYPKEENIEPVEEIRKRFRKDGEILELTYTELIEKVGKERAEKIWRNAQ